MGMVYVDLEVAAEGGPGRTVRFLVDSGALYSVLPHDVWQALGLAPTRRMEFVLADGTTIERPVSHCFFTYLGTRAPSPVVLGEPADDALLGTITLENLGLILNPFDRTLRPIRARLGAMRPLRPPAPPLGARGSARGSDRSGRGSPPA
jgi:predicted aspartyl protease